MEININKMKLLIKLIQLVGLIGLASGKVNNFNGYHNKERAGLVVGKPSSSSSSSSSSLVVNEVYQHDANLEISLLDVEPEANLFIDESLTYPVDINHNGPLHHHHQYQHQQQQQASRNESIDIRHLALVHPGASALVRANYGSFSIKKLIDPFETVKSADNNSSSSTNDSNIKLGNKLKLKQKWNTIISEQMTAYLITKEISRAHPVLRVLFYSNHLLLNEYKPSLLNSGLADRSVTMCAAIVVHHHNERLVGTCSPSNNKPNACLAEITLPSLFWPPLDVTSSGVEAAKQQKSSLAKIFYTVVHLEQGQVCNEDTFKPLLEGTAAELNSSSAAVNLVYLSEVVLTPFRGSYEEVTNDNVVTILVPQEPVYPNSKMYIPVKYTYNPDYPVSSFTLKVHVKPGVRILGAYLSHPNKLWQLKVNLSSKQNAATVTAYLRDMEMQSDSVMSEDMLLDDLVDNISQEIYTWLIEIEPDIDMSEVNGKLVWQLLYNTDSNVVVGGGGGGEGMQNEEMMMMMMNDDFEREASQLISVIDIQKDIVQQVLPISKSKELLNTAVLNGRQISRSIRVYQVSVSGSINDVTFQCSCQSADESILKVSPSCTSVYLDGSEVRGSQNATVIIKYGSFVGYGAFTVWMPLLPLDVRVSDTRLSQIADWKVPQPVRRGIFPFNVYSSKNYRLDYLKKQMIMEENEDYWASSCRLRYQHAKVEIYTRFLSFDNNSGREASLLNRRYSVRTTHIIENLIKVSDSKVLRVRGNIVEGVGAGSANIEIISPLTGSVIGSKEVHVTNDKESVTRIDVKLVSGLELAVEPYPSSTNNIWTVRTTMLSKLSKQYQEALLATKVHFTDGTSIDLSEVPPADYRLVIDTFNGVVANVPHSGTLSLSGLSNVYPLPSILALSPGKGELIHVSLGAPNTCQREPLKLLPLSASYVFVEVDFLPSESNFQNDAFNLWRFPNNANQSMGDRYANKLTPLGKYRKRLGYKTYQPIMESDQIRYQKHSLGKLKESDVAEAEEESLQFGIYSLLLIVSVASIIIVILYTTFATRSPAGMNSSTCTVSQDEASENNDNNNNNQPGREMQHSLNSLMRYLNNQFGVTTSLINDKEWVWVGKDELGNRTQGKHLTINPLESDGENICMPLRSMPSASRSPKKTKHIPIPTKRDASNKHRPQSCSSPAPPPVPPHRSHPNNSIHPKTKRISNFDVESCNPVAAVPAPALPPPSVPLHRNIKQITSKQFGNVNKLGTASEHKPTPVRPKHLMLSKRNAPRRKDSGEKNSGEPMIGIDPSRMHLIEHLKESSA